MRILVLMTLILSFSGKSFAGFLLETNGSYLSESLAVSSTNTASKVFYNIGFLFSLSNDVWGGWNYMSLSQSDTVSSSTTTYAPVDAGPSIKWQFGKGHSFSLSMTYNFVSNATYTVTSGSDEAWTGSSYLISFGMMPEVADGLNLGVSLNYYAATYVKKVVGSTESTASNSKTLIFPVIGLTKAW